MAETRSVPEIFALILLACPLTSSAYAIENISSEEQLLPMGPVQFSTRIDVGMLITAAAFVSTILYNFWQMKKTEENLRWEMDRRDQEQKQQMLAQQEQIKANQEQIRNDKRISEAGFWLTLRDMMSRYDTLSSYFGPDGKWGYSLVGTKGPKTPKEWAMVESYMMLLQQLNVLIDQEILSQQTFDRLYGQRVDFIFYNDIVRTRKLVLEGPMWKEFSHLCMKAITPQTWPPFWVYIIVLESVITGDIQSAGITLFDSLESLKRDDEYYLPKAKVKVEVFYPSSKKDTFEGETDENGSVIFNWNIEEDSLVIQGKQKENITNEAKIVVDISKENNHMWNLTKSFRIEPRQLGGISHSSI
jgi:hypothetical protein